MCAPALVDQCSVATSTATIEEIDQTVVSWVARMDLDHLTDLEF